MTRNGPTLIAAVSDGAGSARLSRLGSRIVALQFCRSVCAYLARNGDLSRVTEDRAAEWLDDVRDRIDTKAATLGASPRSFAATLVGCVVQSDTTVIVHVGDGACAVRLAGEMAWQVPSWPAQGEYAATTYFVTDDPQCRTVVTKIDGPVEEIALFSDGLERLALEFESRSAFRPFFETMFAALRQSKVGRQRGLSRDLRWFLDGPSVNDRTDDDKTLIMARLMAEPVAATPPSQLILG